MSKKEENASKDEWSGLCSAGRHGLDYRGQVCDLCPTQAVQPIQKGFEYEVRLAVSIPIAWAELLKEASKHHYDYKCRESGDHGTVNGLYNTAQGGPLESTLAVTWRDLDLVTKVAEQLEYHTNDHQLIGTIRTWLRQTKDAIEKQRCACMELPGSAMEVT